MQFDLLKTFSFTKLKYFLIYACFRIDISAIFMKRGLTYFITLHLQHKTKFINLPRLPTLSSRSRDLSACCRCGGTAVSRVSERDLRTVLFQTMSEEYPKREGPCSILKLQRYKGVLTLKTRS